MGMSSSAHIFLGCSLMASNHGEEIHPSLQHWQEENNPNCKWEQTMWDAFQDELDGGLHEPFGLPYPPDILKKDSAWQAWKKEYLAKVPVEIRSVAGFYEFPAFAMVVTRTMQTSSEYGLEVVDVSKLFALNSEESVAYHKALDFIGFTGDREIRCLMGADYG